MGLSGNWDLSQIAAIHLLLATQFQFFCHSCRTFPSSARREYSSQTKTLEHSLCDNFKPRQSPAFVLDHINVAFGIHSGTNCIEDLTVEEETSAVTESPEKFSCLTIEYINFPLVLIHDVHTPLIRVARKFDRNG